MANTTMGLNKRQLEIAAYSMATLQYDDTPPNFFRVQNAGNSAVYCSPDNIPTQTRHDFSVPAGSLRSYAEPNARRQLFILNPSGSPVTVTVLAFYAEFDPVTMALSGLEVTIPGTIQASSEISSFTCSLPTGSNVIGKVGLDTIDSTNLSGIGYLLGRMEGRTTITHSDDTTINALDYDAPTGSFVEKIVFCSNDGSTDKVLTWYDYEDGESHMLTIKPGEAVNEFPVYARTIQYAAGGGRIAYTVRGA